MRLAFFFVSVLVASVKTDCGGEFKIICYFSSWTGIHPEAKNCTHIVYTFARIEDDNTLTGKEISIDRSLVHSTAAASLGVWNNPLKDYKNTKDPELKVLLAVGGQDYAIRRANEMMSKYESRQKFVISTTKLMRTHEFDGIDLNFEPSEALGPPSSPTPQIIDDKKRLTTLCKVRQISRLWGFPSGRVSFIRICKRNMLKKRVEQDAHVCC